MAVATGRGWARLGLGPRAAVPGGDRAEVGVAARRGPAGRLSADRGRVLDQLVQGAVARDPADREHVTGGRLAGAEPRSARVVHRDIARHVQQRGRRRPSGGRDEQVGRDPAAVVQLDGPHPAVAVHPQHVVALPRVGHVHHVDPGPLEVGDGGVARGVRGQHDSAVARLDRVQADQPAGRGGQHHAWRVVAGEHVGPFNQPAGHDEAARPRLDQPFRDARQAALDHRDPVLVVPAEHSGVGQHFDALGRAQLGQQAGQRRRVRPAQVPAELVLLLDQQHPGAGGRRRHRGREAGRAAARDEHVGMGVPLVVVAVRGVR